MMMIMMIATDSMNLCHEYNYYNKKKEHHEFFRAVTKVYYVRVRTLKWYCFCLG